LLKVRSADTSLNLESSHLTRVDKLLTDVEQRMEVASRVLEDQFCMSPAEDIVVFDDQDLPSEVDRYLHSPNRNGSSSTASVSYDKDTARGNQRKQH
jgi:hypothetical protein